MECEFLPIVHGVQNGKMVAAMKVRTKIHDIELRPAWYFRLAYLEGIVLGMGLLAAVYWVVR